MDFTQYNFIKQKYEGILEIYPQKTGNGTGGECIFKIENGELQEVEEE